MLAVALNQAIRCRTFFRAAYYVPYVTASVAVVGVWLFLFSTDGLVNQILGPLAPDPSWLVNSTWAMPIDRTLRDVEAARLLHPAVPGGVAERPEGAVRIRIRRRRGGVAIVPVRHRARGSTGQRAGAVAGNRHRRESVHRALPADRTAAVPTGPRRHPVLLMYQQGIEQGKPDIASAIGVVLVIVVLIVALVNRRFAERTGTMTTPLADQCPFPTMDLEPPIFPGRCRRGVSRWRRVLTMVALFIGALVFLFPFYYMIVGSLQRTPDTSVAGAFPSPVEPDPRQLHPDQRVAQPRQSLLNSGIFTGGVLLCTVVFGCWRAMPLPCCSSVARGPSSA